jgi:GTP-binding protein EngB required for normal cell division
MGKAPVTSAAIAPPESLLHLSPQSALVRVEAICREFGIDSLRPQLAACAEMLKDGDAVDVAVVGRFKAGKSSFLNSLVGRPLVPVAVLPLTAVVTRLRHGPRDRALVRHQDGREEEIPLDRLAEFVSEPGNPGNEKAVAIVDVETPDLEAYRGIRFVDTPGLGSVFTHNTRTSMDWLPRVGAALLAVSVDHPLSDQDQALLQELAKHTPEVAILLTKADLVSPKELADVTRFIGDQVEKTGGEALRVFPFSTRPGYEALRGKIQAHLLRRVAERREERAREILDYKLRSLIAACREYLGMALSAAGAAAGARGELARQLAEERESLAAVQNEIWVLALDLKGRVQADALGRYLRHAPDLLARMTESLRSAMSQWRGNLRRTSAQFAEWAQDALHAELGPLSHQEGEELIVRHLAAARDSFNRVVRGFQNRLAQGIERALHLTFSGASFEARIEQPQRPDIRVSRVFDLSLEVVWFLIPMGLFRPLVNRHFLRRLPWEVDKNLHRLAAQWSQAATGVIDDLAGQARGFMRQELGTIDGLVSKAQDRRPAIEQALAALDRLEQGSGGPRGT